MERDCTIHCLDYGGTMIMKDQPYRRPDTCTIIFLVLHLVNLQFYRDDTKRKAESRLAFRFDLSLKLTAHIIVSYREHKHKIHLNLSICMRPFNPKKQNKPLLESNIMKILKNGSVITTDYGTKNQKYTNHGSGVTHKKACLPQLCHSLQNR